MTGEYDIHPDELVELRTEIEHQRITIADTMSDLAKAEAEIARLRVQRDEQDGSIKRLLDDLDAAQTTIERLTAERDEWKAKWLALAQASLVIAGEEPKLVTQKPDVEDGM